MTSQEQLLDAVMMALGHDHEIHPEDKTCLFLAQAHDILIAVRTTAA